MKVCVILGLLFVGINGEKKINLEDIERDNLRAEGSSKPGHAPETKYLINPEINHPRYQFTSKYNGPQGSPGQYVAPPSTQNLPPETYVQPPKYVLKEQAYQQQNSILPEQALPPQYYTQYQQQHALPPKGIAPNVYEPQQLAYQPEVPVGNQLQSVQQKSVSAKYAKNMNKETVYVNIPMMHLLTYYPNLNVNPKSNGLLTQPVLTTAPTEQISIPLYTSTLSQKPIIPVKSTYQVQYAPKYSAPGPAAFTNKVAKQAIYTPPPSSKKVNSSPVISLPTYVPSDQSYAQGRQLLYTQAYIAPSHPQYVSQLVYAQPTTVYMHATPVYSDVYAREPSYVQDNSLHASVKYATVPEELNGPAPPLDEEQPRQALGQESSQTVAQNYVKDFEEPSTDLVPPQLPPQDFRSDSTPLVAAPSQEEESIPIQSHVPPSGPRSLLDSYVPSKLIAAQDSARYEERPIQLESGFLPSKENFLYKKRKTD